MENQDFNLTLLCESHQGLERQGPGSPEMTMKALSFLDGLNETSRIADLGCGTGGQTFALAQNLTGTITGIDFIPEFINVFNENAVKQNLQTRVHGIVGSMDDLPFPKGELDLIWSEGAIAGIGFEKGINYWRDFLKPNGYISITYESWFTNKRPEEIEKWWVEAVPEISTVGQNILMMQKAGYAPIAAFALPEECWTENYFVPRDAAGKALLAKYPGNNTVQSFVAGMDHEADLYSKYRQYYGYVFYIGKRI